jgi:glycerophosphoryl diester phosphodiesterase
MDTPIAHRALHDAAAGRPENSLAALAHACAHGFPAEIDVRLTRDRQVVVFHDRALKRLTGAVGRVEERDAAALTRLRLLGTGERVPLLRDALELVAGRVPLLIDLKSSAVSPALERAVLDALRGYGGEVAMQSFRRRAVRTLSRCEAPHAIGHLRRRGTLLAAAGVRPAFVGYRVDAVATRAVRRRRECGAVLLAWTVRSPADARRALCFVDNYIFEGFVPDGHEVTGGGPLASP